MFRLAVLSAALLGWLATAEEKRCLNSALNSYARCGDVASLIHAPGQHSSIFLGRDYDSLLEHVAEKHGSGTNVLTFSAHVGKNNHEFSVADQEGLEKALALAGMLGVVPELQLPDTISPTLSPTTASPTPEPCAFQYIRYKNVKVRNPGGGPGAKTGNHFCLYKVEFTDKNGNVEPSKVDSYYPTKKDGNAYTDLIEDDVVTDDDANKNDSHWCNHFNKWGENDGWIIWDMGNKVLVDKYKIWAHHQWNFPSVWTLSGSNDKKVWTEISKVEEGVTDTSDGKTFTMCEDCGFQEREFKTTC